MAHFYGTVAGGKGRASRCGTRGGGLVVQTAGWKCGLRIVAKCEDDHDEFVLYTTGGIDQEPKLAGKIKDFEANKNIIISTVEIKKCE